MSEDSGAPEEEISVEDELSVDELDTSEQDALLSTMESAPDETAPSHAKSTPPGVETAPDADPDEEGGELETITVPGGTPAVVDPSQPKAASSAKPGSTSSLPARTPTSKRPTPISALPRPSSTTPRSVVPRPRSQPPSKLPPPPARGKLGSMPPRTPPPRAPLPASQAPAGPAESTPPNAKASSKPPAGSEPPRTGRASQPPSALARVGLSSRPPSAPPRAPSRPPGSASSALDIDATALKSTPPPDIPFDDDDDEIDDEMDRPTLVHNPDADPSVEEAIASARAAAEAAPPTPPQPPPPAPPADEDTADGGEDRAAIGPGGLPLFDDDDVDLAKTVKLERRRTPSMVDEEEAEGDKPPEIPSLGADAASGRKSRSGRRRRSRKGKRRMVKIPDDNVPATPTPPAVAEGRELMDSLPPEDEHDRLSDYPDDGERDSVVPIVESAPPPDEEIDPHRRESAPGIFTDEAAIAVLRPIQIVSDLPAMEPEEVDPEPQAPPGPPPTRPTHDEAGRKLPPPRSDALEEIEEIEDVEPEDMPRPPGPPPPRIGVADATGQQKALTPEELAKVPLSGTDTALAEARAKEAEAKARVAQARAREAAAKAEAAARAAKPPKKPWWMVMFEDELIRTLDNPKKRDVEKEADFLVKVMRLDDGARILDLACGAGVHAVELSSRGYQVVGVDHSQTMLDLAGAYNKQRGTSVSLIQGDMRQLSLEGIFDGIYCWGASFGFFDDANNAQVLERVARALRPGGVFSLDVPNRDFVAPRAPTMAWFEKPGVVCMDEMRFDFYSSRMITKRMILFETGKSREVEMSIRLYTLTELGRLFHKVGLKILDVTGHRAHPGAYFGAESPRIIITGKRREDD